MEWYHVLSLAAMLIVFFTGVVLALRYGVQTPRIRTLLLDADGTLLDFDRSEASALEATFRQLGFAYDASVHRVYHEKNEACWKALERGEISREELKVRRFAQTFHSLGIEGDPVSATKTYEENLGQFAFPYPGSEEACSRLSKKYDLYLVTNGLKNVQSARLLKTRIPEFLKGIYISEEVGYAKPAAEFFDVFFSQHPECNRNETMIVGDSLSGDIQGGNNAGIYTCWVNRSKQPRPNDLRIDLEIDDITKLEREL